MFKCSLRAKCEVMVYGGPVMKWVLGAIVLRVLWLVVGFVINRVFHRDELEEDESDDCPYE